MQIVERDGGFDLVLDGRAILRHRPHAPCLIVGRGRPRVSMYRGNFDIEDESLERAPLAHAEVDGATIRFAEAPGAPVRIALKVESPAPGEGVLTPVDVEPGLDRFSLRLVAEPGERVFGGGEQMSHLDLSGRRFPLWTSEPGVGRDRTSEITFKADAMGRAGGDYFHTNYPQPTLLSSRRYALHVESRAYAVFDLRRHDRHEIEVWDVPARIELYARPSMAGLVCRLSERFGRQPPLPEWLMGGAIVGLKDGGRSFERLERYLEAGCAVSGLWCEDWVGVRDTSFGRRLFWDWRANESWYPDLKARIAALRERGVRFLGYVNPYLCVDGTLYEEARALGHLGLDDAGEPYAVDFGEFYCGVVDFTKPEAAHWFEERVIGREMLDYGLSGWMADFGEYLPTDVALASGVPGMLAHNEWPVIWASVNARAIARRGMTGQALFFMRAGHTGVQAHCPLLWGGDQCVDFSRHDGLVSAICGALSAGLVGNAYHHSDIGGYTSLFGNVRTAELMIRWAEMAAFTPVMRTHEGNRPRENLQFDDSPELLAHFARLTRIWTALTPYLRALMEEAQATGLPCQRPLFLHHEDDPDAWGVQDAYLYGRDLLVAPVWRPAHREWTTRLPTGTEWVHLWSGERFAGGTRALVRAPFGEPPVFRRADSAFAELFDGLRAIR